MERKIEDPKLSDRRKWRRQPYKTTLHQRIVQHFIFAIEQRLSILAFFQRDRRAPNQRLVFVFRRREGIAETLDRVSVGKHEINGKSDLEPLDCFVESRPEHLGFFLDLAFVSASPFLCFYEKLTRVT